MGIRTYRIGSEVPRGVIRYADGRVADPSEFGGPFERIEVTTVCDVEPRFILAHSGALTVNEIRAIERLAPIGRERAHRWRCTYCAGERTGDVCVGCGAPRETGTA